MGRVFLLLGQLHLEARSLLVMIESKTDCIGSFRCLVVSRFDFCLLLDNILLDNLKCLVSGVCPGLSGTELVEMR